MTARTESGCSMQLPLIVYSLLIISVSLPNSRVVDAQSSRPYGGLYRSHSEPRLNRNSTYHRQSSYSDRRDSCKTNYKFDYIQLALMWAPGFCQTSPKECKREERRHFTVHGMWPTIKGTQEPSDCCFDNTFDYKSIEDLLPTLNDWWFSYYETNGNRKFWTHEWLKHGTCARDIASLRGEKRYFGTTVQLAKQLPILDVLNKAGIVADNKKIYDSSDISKVLSQMTGGKTFQIDCDYKHDTAIPVIKGMNFCFDANLKFSDCPEMKSRCRRQLIFPACDDSSHVC